MKKQIVAILAGAMFMMGMANVANAIPTLQLDIAGGTYNSTHDIETIMASSNQFTLYAYLIANGDNPLTDTYYISGALVPASNSGSFKFNGTTYSQSGMQFGTPPIEASLEHESKDLQTHGIFPAYFFQKSFQFTVADKLTAYNTQDTRYVNPLTSSPFVFGSDAMYYKAFDVDLSLLDFGDGVHFDLYNLTTCSANNYKISEFAPFSHDAEGWKRESPPPAVPEPGTMMLLGMGMLGLAVYGKRRMNKEA